MGSITWLRRRRAVLIATTTCLALSGVLLVVGDRDSAAGGGSSSAGVLLASAPVLPDDRDVDVAVLATKKRAIRRTWRRFNLPGSPPGSVMHRDALFLGTSESGSCPEEFVGMDRIEGERLVKVDIDVNWSGPGGACTDDFRPRTFVVAARQGFFPEGRFDVKIGSNRRVSVERRP